VHVKTANIIDHCVPAPIDHCSATFLAKSPLDEYLCNIHRQFPEQFGLNSEKPADIKTCHTLYLKTPYTCPDGEICQTKASDSFPWWSPIGGGFILGGLIMIADVLSEPSVGKIVDGIQLFAGLFLALIVYLFCQDFNRQNVEGPRPGINVFLYIPVALVCSTLLSIPVLGAIWVVTTALHGIVDPPEASMAAVGGSAGAMISIFSERSFEAGAHHFATGLLNQVIRRLHLGPGS
jgi:hypothetical protein